MNEWRAAYSVKLAGTFAVRESVSIATTARYSTRGRPRVDENVLFVRLMPANPFEQLDRDRMEDDPPRPASLLGRLVPQQRYHASAEIDIGPGGIAISPGRRPARKIKRRRTTAVVPRSMA